MTKSKPYKEQKPTKTSVGESLAEYCSSSTIRSSIDTTDVTIYWNMLKDLSSEVKLELISRLSSSLLIKKNTKALESADWASQFAGKWSDSRSADEIVEDIRNSRSTNREIEL